MEWSTADICDWCGDNVEYVDPIFNSYGINKQFCGKIRTVKCHEDNSFVKKLLGTPSQGGEVLVIDGGGSNRRALVGDLIAASAVKNGWAGIVVFGYIRDSAAINGMNIGVKALGTHPRKTDKRDIGDIDVPVKFGGVVFTPGDWLYSDDDGIIVSHNDIRNRSKTTPPPQLDGVVAKDGVVCNKDGNSADDVMPNEEGIMTRRRSAALAAAAAAAAATASAVTVVEEDGEGEEGNDDNAIIPSVKDTQNNDERQHQQQPCSSSSSSSAAAAVAVAAALLHQRTTSDKHEEATAKSLVLDPSPPATVLPASAQPFLADMPVDKPSASEIRRNLTPREARQLAELQYHEQLRAYQRWVAAIAEAMRERAAAAAAEHDEEEEGGDKGEEGEEQEHEKRSIEDNDDDDHDGISSSPARKIQRTDDSNDDEMIQTGGGGIVDGQGGNTIHRPSSSASPSPKITTEEYPLIASTRPGQYVCFNHYTGNIRIHNPHYDQQRREVERSQSSRVAAAAPAVSEGVYCDGLGGGSRGYTKEVEVPDGDIKSIVYESGGLRHEYNGSVMSSTTQTPESIISTPMSYTSSTTTIPPPAAAAATVQRNSEGEEEAVHHGSSVNDVDDDDEDDDARRYNLKLIDDAISVCGQPSYHLPMAPSSTNTRNQRRQGGYTNDSNTNISNIRSNVYLSVCMDATKLGLALLNVGNRSGGNNNNNTMLIEATEVDDALGSTLRGVVEGYVTNNNGTSAYDDALKCLILHPKKSPIVLRNLITGIHQQQQTPPYPPIMDDTAADSQALLPQQQQQLGIIERPSTQYDYPSCVQRVIDMMSRFNNNNNKPPLSLPITGGHAQLWRALSGLLSFLDEAGLINRYRPTGVVTRSLQGMLQVDSITLRTLGITSAGRSTTIVAGHNHRIMTPSIARLLERYISSPPGRLLLHRWLALPHCDIKLIELRLRDQEIIIDSLSPELIMEIGKHLKKHRDLSRILSRVVQGFNLDSTSRVATWLQLLRSCRAASEVIRAIEMLPSDSAIKSDVRCISMLLECRTPLLQIQNLIDGSFDMDAWSATAAATTGQQQQKLSQLSVKTGVIPQLDELRSQYDKLEDILTRMGAAESKALEDMLINNIDDASDNSILVNSMKPISTLNGSVPSNGPWYDTLSTSNRGNPAPRRSTGSSCASRSLVSNRPIRIQLQYFPQMGFVASLPSADVEEVLVPILSSKDTTAPVEHTDGDSGWERCIDIITKHLEGWQFKFRTTDTAYFKSPITCRLDNYLGNIEAKMRDIEYEYLYRLADRLEAIGSHPLAIASTALAELDCLTGLARASRENGWCKPVLIPCDSDDDDIVMELKGSWHPLMVDDTTNVDNRGHLVVSNDILITSDCKTHILTGPNYSGKSVLLKQIGITAVSVALSNCTSSTLILLDEFGKGTSPVDEVSLLAGIIKYTTIDLSTASSPTLILTSHYGAELFSWGLVENGAHTHDSTHSVVEGIQGHPTKRSRKLTVGRAVPSRLAVVPPKADSGDSSVLSFLYKLERGKVSQSSYPIQCAIASGVCPSVTNRALEIFNTLSRQFSSSSRPFNTPSRFLNKQAPKSSYLDLRRSTALEPYLSMSSNLLFNKVGNDKGVPANQQIRLYRSSSSSHNNNMQPRPPSSGNWWSKVIGVSAAGYAVMKLKGLKILIPVLKFSKAGPLLSMCISTLAYGAVFGWQFGIGMVGLIFIHELGHALMMKNLGVPAGPMVFIPFMGASVEMRKHPSNAYQEALIALAGPILGSLGVLPIAAYGAATGSQLAFALTHFGYMINLFNLLPVGQLDGGRVAGSLNNWFLPAGLAICGSMIYFTPYCSPIMYLVFLGGAYSTYQRFFGTGDMPPYYYNMTNAQKACISAGYFGLIAALMYGMYENDKRRKSPKQLQRELGINLGGGSWGQSLINNGETTVGGSDVYGSARDLWADDHDRWGTHHHHHHHHGWHSTSTSTVTTETYDPITVGDVLGPLHPSSDQQQEEGVVAAVPTSPVVGASSSEGSAGPLSASRPGTAGSSVNSFSPLADHYHFAQLDIASILGQSTSRLLSDRSYEKRSMAAHEIESRVRQALQQRDYYGQDQTATANIVSVITVLTSSNFTKSPYPNSRKGGLLGLASVAIALENKNLDPFLDSLISPVLYLFDDEDSRCRYYACEAMFNISKVARGLLLKGRRMCLALDGVCRLVADVDQEVKSGAQYLDRLLKDIVSDVANKPFILREIKPYEPGTEVSASPASESSWPASLTGYIPSPPPPISLAEGMSPTTSTSGDAYPYRSTDNDSIDATPINIITTPETPSLPSEPQGQRLMHLQQQATTTASSSSQGAGVGLFDLGAFIGRISAHLRVANPFIKQLAMSWISVLHSLPTTRDLLLLHLPLFLGTLFSLQRDPSRGDLRHTADQVLGEFLDDLTSSAAALASNDDDNNNNTTIGPTKLRLIVAKSISIVVSNCSSSPSTESLTRLTAMNWLYTILSSPGLLLPNMPTDEAVLDMPEECDSPRVTMDANAASNLRTLLPTLLEGILGCVDAKEAEVSRKAVEAHTLLLSAVEAIGGRGGGGGRPLNVTSPKGDETADYSTSCLSGDDVNDDRVISVVCHYLSGPLDQTVTRACCLQWVSLLLEQSPQELLRDAQCSIDDQHELHQSEGDKRQHRPSLLDSVFATLQHPSSEVCIAALQVLSRIASLPDDDEYFPIVCTRLLELLRTNRKSITPSDDDMDEDTGLPSTAANSDEAGNAHQQKLQSLALRYRLIIRHLCCYVDVERFYRHIAQRLQDDEDAEFRSMAVYLFNWILLTAPETNTLREALYDDASTPLTLAFKWQQLMDLAAGPSSDSNGSNDEDMPLFVRILLPWMSNPASALSLCLWVGRYALACKFVGIIAEDQVSIGAVPWSVRKGRITRTSSSHPDVADDGAESLLQLDQLVHLLESPVFTKLRLELLPNSYLLDVKPEKEKRQCLLDCLVGLVMLVPQNTRAFQLLKERLDIVHKAFALCHHI
ncbi:PtdIns(3,5)P(2) sythesis regulation factor [Perkinsus chesapeaki]|uniref:4-hydroxy-4-methyl-2-oxoglutarate aldolase n=1 Tax=Perkinsus chesapeaki TaxID=330153 RepID=A0A7J6N224_PERCH|nr:PtdIns(3,5)P(2) sythesis regulation factor [Perkinsus chesapeaki]